MLSTSIGAVLGSIAKLREFMAILRDFEEL
jgi:hypothetical protein